MRSILLFAILLFCHANCFGQDPYYNTINKLNGLPSNSVYAMYQDSKGFIWIANNEGLTRYDGFEFKTYTCRGQTSRSGNNIVEDQYGRIWYKNFDGYLYYVEHDSLHAVAQNTPVGNTEYAIIKDRLMVIQKKGVDIFDLHTLRLLKTIELDINLFISELCWHDRFYIMLENVMYAISPTGELQQTTVEKGGILAGANNGMIYLSRYEYGAANNLYYISGTGCRLFVSLQHVSHTHGIAFADSLYWVFTPNGVWVYDDSGKNINGAQPFFATKSISSILKDRDGNYWLGTLNEGIMVVPDLNTKLIATGGFEPNILSAVNAKLYLGTKDNSIYTYDLGSNRFDQKFHSDFRHEVLCFLADYANNRINFSSSQFFYTDTGFSRVKALNANSMKDIARADSKYYAVALTGMIALMKVRDDVVSEFDSIYNANIVPSIEHAAVLVGYTRGRSVAVNPLTKTIYGGTGKGLFIITAKGASPLTHKGEPLYTKKLVYYRGAVYLLTQQNEVMEISKDNSIREVVLPGEHEQYINIRKAGSCLYLLAKNGIRVLDTTTGHARILNLRPGVRAEEVNDLEVIDNQIVFATERGLIVVSRDARPQPNDTPTFFINNVLVNGLPASRKTDLVLSYKENSIEINYSILSFSSGCSYNLWYKINDGRWQMNQGKTRTLKLASLAPGDYRIYFRLSSTDTDKNYAQQSVNIRVRSPFWKESWFMFGCMVLLGGGGYWYYKWQTGLLKKQNQLKVDKVELERNLRNSMLTSIKSQMNPHFFYNALNAIQSFIFSDDKRNASTYLVKLSNLTRMILEMSEKESITLDEEMGALKLYLELEKMRFSDDFNYELQAGRYVETDLLRIPPMIVQPYVENALKHGLLHKKGAKYLIINFERVGNDLQITIDDNGIGREKALELRQLKKEKHHPFATDANYRRIELLNKGRRNNIGVAYTDKTDGQGMASGTKVTITIPLI
jgi:hypothetical protein